MKRTLLFLGLTAMMLMSSCSSNKNTAQNDYRSPFGETYESPCLELDSDTEFGATGIYQCSASQKGQAQSFALQNAQQQIRMKMQHVYRGMVSDFSQNYGGNAGNDIQNKITIAGDQVINEVINDTRATCVKFSGVDDRGNIECYVGIRISKTKLAKEISHRVSDALTQDEKARIDFNEHRYREDMEARFRRFQENN